MSVPTGEIQNEGLTPLWWAAYNKQWDVVRLLVEKEGINLEASPAEGPTKGITALWWAAYHDQWDLVKLLVEKGARADASPAEGPNKGTSALWWAPAYKQWDLLELVIEKNPQLINQLDSTGRSVLDYAKGQRAPNVQRLKEKQDAVAEVNEANTRFRHHANWVRKLGHGLGISKDSIQLRLPSDGSFVNISFEGAHDPESISLLLQLVKKYADSKTRENPDFFQKIEKALIQTDKYLQCDVELNAQKLIEPAQRGELVITPLAYPGHATGFAIYKDALVFCNRGGDLGGGDNALRVYRKNENTDTPLYEYESELISLLNNSSHLTEQEIHDSITEQTQQYTKIALPSQDQKHGTCSFVNPKASLQGILYLLKREQLALASEITDPSILHKTARRYAEKEYKNFTTFMRNVLLTELLTEMKTALQALQNPDTAFATDVLAKKDDVLFYNQLLIVAIKAHHGSKKESSPAKREGELERMRMVYDALQDFSEVRQEIIDELEKHGIAKQLFESVSAIPKSEEKVATEKNIALTPEVVAHSTDAGLLRRIAYNTKTDADTLEAVAKNPNTELDILKYIASNLRKSDVDILETIAENPNVDMEFLKDIANHPNAETSTFVAIVRNTLVTSDILSIVARKTTDISLLRGIAENLKADAYTLMDVAVKTTDATFLKELAENPRANAYTLGAVARNTNVRLDTLRYIAKHEQVNASTLIDIASKTTDATFLKELAENPKANAYTLAAIAKTPNVNLAILETVAKDPRANEYTFKTVVNNTDANPEALKHIASNTTELETLKAIATHPKVDTLTLAAVAENPNVDIEFLREIAKHPKAGKMTFMAIVRNTLVTPAVLSAVARYTTDATVLQELAENPRANDYVFDRVCENTDVEPETLSYIASNTSELDNLDAIAKHPKADALTLAAVAENPNVDMEILKDIAKHPRANDATLKAILERSNLSDEAKAIVEHRFAVRAKADAATIANNTKKPLLHQFQSITKKEEDKEDNENTESLKHGPKK